MGTEDGDGKNPWLRVSAWLLPGLALGWLATLATLMHGVAMTLAAWGATVSVVLLAVVLMHWLRRLMHSLRRSRAAGGGGGGGDLAAENGDAAGQETAKASTKFPPDPAEPTLPPAPEKSLAPPVTNPDPHPGPWVGTPIVPGSAVPELRVLTAEEAAAVLRVDAELVKASISSGEFPGNRIGPHWLVEQGALARWLQGTYRS
jgi:hypothetical protein